VVAWQQQDRQTQTSNQSNSLAHARRPRKAASHARQRPLLQANQQGLTCLLQAHQQGLACLAAMMRDPSSNVLGICVALCLLNFQHLAALCPSEEGLDVESRVLVRKHMGALLEKWPLLSGVSADIDAPQEVSRAFPHHTTPHTYVHASSQTLSCFVCTCRTLPARVALQLTRICRQLSLGTWWAC
jgi:hypothetical protein